VRLISAGEAGVAGTEARGGVARAGDASCTNWTGVKETKFSMGQKGKDEALLWDLGVCSREDKLLGGPSGRDFIYNKRLFRCGRNGVLRLPVPFLPLLLFNDCKEGELFWVGVWNRTLLSIDLWILTDLLEVCDAVLLLLSPIIGSSISPKFKKQERWDSSSLIPSSSAPTTVCKPDICGVFTAPASFPGTSNSPPPMSSACSSARIINKISVISISRSVRSIFVSCSLL
jgi:hypothetical protein